MRRFINTRGGLLIVIDEKKNEAKVKGQRGWCDRTQLTSHTQTTSSESLQDMLQRAGLTSAEAAVDWAAVEALLFVHVKTS